MAGAYDAILAAAELFALHAEQPTDRPRLSLAQVAVDNYRNLIDDLDVTQLAALLSHYDLDTHRVSTLRNIWSVSKIPTSTGAFEGLSAEDAQLLIAAFDTPLGKARAHALIRPDVTAHRLAKGDSSAAKARVDAVVIAAVLPSLLADAPRGASAPERVALAWDKAELLTALPSESLSHITAAQRERILASVSTIEGRTTWVRVHSTLMAVPPRK